VIESSRVLEWKPSPVSRSGTLIVTASSLRRSPLFMPARVAGRRSPVAGQSWSRSGDRTVSGHDQVMDSSGWMAAVDAAEQVRSGERQASEVAEKRSPGSRRRSRHWRVWSSRCSNGHASEPLNATRPLRSQACRCCRRTPVSNWPTPRCGSARKDCGEPTRFRRRRLEGSPRIA